MESQTLRRNQISLTGYIIHSAWDLTDDFFALSHKTRMNMNITIWKILGRLPIELLGSDILSMLELRDCVHLDSALVKQSDRSILGQGLSVSVPLRSIEVREEETAKLAWLQQRLVSGLCFVVHNGFETRETYEKYTSVIKFITINVSDDPFIIGIADILFCPLMTSQVTRLAFDRPMKIINVLNLFLELENLEHLAWVYSENTESWCAQLLVNNPHMKTLRLRNVYRAMGGELAEAIAQAGQLEELNMDYVCFTGTWYSDSLDENLAAIAAASVATEKTLALKRVVVLSHEDDGVGEGLVALVQRCPLLQELTLQKVSFTGGGDYSEATLLSACRNLRVLDFKGMFFAGKELDALVGANPPLETLSVTWSVFSLDAVQRASSLFSRILKAEISFDDDGGDDERHEDEVVFADSLSAALQLMPRLRDLALTCSSYIVRRVGRITHALRKLVLFKVSTGEADIELELCSIIQWSPRLVELTANTLQGLQWSDSVLKALAAHCPGLKIVHVRQAKAFTDAGVVALAEGCAQLEKVALLGTTLLTDASVLALAKGCPKLREFTSHSPQITDSAQIQLIHCCRHLHLLVIDYILGNSNVAHARMRALQEHRAGLCVAMYFVE